MRNELSRNRNNWLSQSRDDLFDRFMRSPLSLFDELDQGSWRTDVDIEQTDDAFLVSIDMPGVKNEDIKIDISGNVLSVSGERKTRRKGDDQHYESYGRFQRSFTLPSTIDPQRVEANLEDGVLQIALPIAEQSKPRSVQVQTGKSGLFSKLIGRDQRQKEDSQQQRGQH